jgi:hypothetical protein
MALTLKLVMLVTSGRSLRQGPTPGKTFTQSIEEIQKSSACISPRVQLLQRLEEATQRLGGLMRHFLWKKVAGSKSVPQNVVMPASPQTEGSGFMLVPRA